MNDKYLEIINYLKQNFETTSSNKNIFKKFYSDNNNDIIVKLIINMNLNKITITRNIRRNVNEDHKLITITESALNDLDSFKSFYHEHVNPWINNKEKCI
jgi:hypothetical protein